MPMATKSSNMDVSPEMIEHGFAMDVGKCIEMDAEMSLLDGQSFKMKTLVCRIKEDELDISGTMDIGEGEPMKMHSTYRRNVAMKE